MTAQKNLTTKSISPQQFYRGLHQGNDGDAEFYQRTISDADAVLEIGAGWGRLSSVLAPLSLCYWGIELEPSFATEAQAAVSVKKTRLNEKQKVDWQIITGDARTVTLPKARFSHALLPYNVAYAFGGIAGFQAVMHQVFHALKDGGELFLDIYPIDDYHEAISAGEVEPEDDGEKVGDLALHGFQYPVFEESQLDIASQCLDVTYQAKKGSEIVAEHRIQHHYLLLEQMIACIEAAGGEIMLLAGDFSGAPMDAESTQIVLGAIKVSSTP